VTVLAKFGKSLGSGRVRMVALATGGLVRVNGEEIGIKFLNKAADKQRQPKTVH
jgi:hypothetical protein